LIVDEAHRLKNIKSKLFEDLASVPRDWCLLLTGTPLQNSTEELWALLHFCDPTGFGSKDEFTNPELQALYTQLVAQGNLSLADALKVGAAIEEIDIRDLQTRMAQTDNADIQLAYTNLMNGSYKHLQAFTSNLLSQTGETYVPQYLPAEQYQTIISSSVSNGQGNGGQGGGQGNGGQGASSGQSVGQSAATGGVPQANIAGSTTIHGTVVSFDQMGLSLTLNDGSAYYVQLGNSRYSQSIGFAPAVGEGITVYGFPGDQGAYSAINVTLDSTAQVYAFRDAATGQPLWAGKG